MKANDKRMAEAAAWVDWAARPFTEAEDAAAFERWMDSETNRQAFADLSALWRSDALGEAAAGLAVETPRRRTWSVSWRLAIPSIMAAAVGVAAILFAPWMDYRTVETARAETRRVVLADGSTVRMNGAARLSIRQSPMRRSAALQQGEAFFDVRHDGRPFTVDTGEGAVRVMGTAFNVDRLELGRTEVALYRGAVRVRDRANEEMDLKPGDRVVLERGRMRRGAPVRIAQPDWLDGWFDAQDASLGQLVEELDRFSAMPIMIQGSARRTRISGRFHVAQPQSVLELIEAAYGVDVAEENGRILINGHGPQ